MIFSDECYNECVSEKEGDILLWVPRKAFSRKSFLRGSHSGTILEGIQSRKNLLKTIFRVFLVYFLLIQPAYEFQTI